MSDSAPLIHPSAVIDPSAKLADDVRVGAFSLIGADVEIGAGTVVGPHCSIHGPTRIGRDNRFIGLLATGAFGLGRGFLGGGWLISGRDDIGLRVFSAMASAHAVKPAGSPEGKQQHKQGAAKGTKGFRNGHRVEHVTSR